MTLGIEWVFQEDVGALQFSEKDPDDYGALSAQ